MNSNNKIFKEIQEVLKNKINFDFKTLWFVAEFYEDNLSLIIKYSKNNVDINSYECDYELLYILASYFKKIVKKDESVKSLLFITTKKNIFFGNLGYISQNEFDEYSFNGKIPKI